MHAKIFCSIVYLSYRISLGRSIIYLCLALPEEPKTYQAGRKKIKKAHTHTKKDENEGKYSTILMYAKIYILLAVNFEIENMIPHK